MTITEVQSRLYRRRLRGCCENFEVEFCKCPKCGADLKKVLHDNKWTKLQCTSCDFEHVCGNVGKAHEHNPPVPNKRRGGP